MLQSISSKEKIKTAQKTSDILDNLYIDEINVDTTLEITFKRVPCIWYPITFQE